jgi:hypothetical protein
MVTRKQGLNYVMVIKEHSLQHDFIMTSIFDATYYGNESRYHLNLSWGA